MNIRKYIMSVSCRMSFMTNNKHGSRLRIDVCECGSKLLSLSIDTILLGHVTIYAKKEIENFTYIIRYNLGFRFYL